ncbi:MAG: glycosyltransferase, partial [Candidatus Thermoplasmatota archaeon]|nr:glycosyltransferase [Candidatus Thermoplasmatota archaeon]
GAAYRDGFRHAKGDVIFEMDADLSHDPKYIPDFLKAIKYADVVVGSRYMRGGGVIDWPFKRKIISAGGNFLARIALGLKMHDITSGYKAYRKEAAAIVQETKSDHYVFQAETLYLAKKKGLIISETPIVFQDRKIGKSKLGNGDVHEFTTYLFRTWREFHFGWIKKKGAGK